MTLIEVMVVVVLIGVFVALAAPSLSRALRDRVAGRVADDVSGAFRIARTRSSSTGAAHTIRLYATGTNIGIQLLMAVDPATKAPVPSCFLPSWTVGNADTVLLSTVDVVADKSAANDGISMTTPTPPGGGAASTGFYCFTPGGTLWQNVAGAGGSWQRPAAASPILFRIQRNDASGNLMGIVRDVYVGGTGIPRIDAYTP